MQEEIPLFEIDSYANLIRDDYDVPGLAVAVVKDDNLELAKGYGTRKLDESELVDENTLFGIASISKSFTALALGMLVDEGKLKWDDPVTNHLPWFQLYDAYATRELTVLDLLVHRSGLAAVSGGTVWYGSDRNRHEVIERIRYLKPVSSFRSEYAYQNITYLVAGEIVQVLTGQSWDNFVAQHIFAPLGMRTSNTSIKAFAAESNVAQPHALINGQIQLIAPRNYDNVGPAASINTSAIELAAYAQLLLNGGQFQGRQLYSPDIARDLWTPHTLIPSPNEYLPALERFMPQFHHAYALGWVIQDSHGQKKVSHSGGIDGLRSMLTMIPQKNLGIIVLANNESPATWIMTNIIHDLYNEADPGTWYDAARGQWYEKLNKRSMTFEGPPVSDTVPSQDLEKYSANFISDLVGDIKIICEREQLSLIFTHTPSFTARLSHWQYDTFRVAWQDPVIPDGLVTFVLDAQGRVVELKLDQANLLDVDFSELHPIRRDDS
jgi:CubicO group peptidase (beta-lactamase class C family)